MTVMLTCVIVQSNIFFPPFLLLLLIILLPPCLTTNQLIYFSTFSLSTSYQFPALQLLLRRHLLRHGGIAISTDGDLFLPNSIAKILSVLDGQAPDIQILANVHDDINHKAAVHAQAQTQAQKHIRNDVLAFTEGRFPARHEVGGESVDDAKDHGDEEDVGVRIRSMNEVRSNDEADLVGRGNTDEEEEGNEMLEENGAEGKPEWDEGPRDEEREETGECGEDRALLLDAGAADINRAV